MGTSQRKVHGPFWTSTATVLKLVDPEDQAALRALYVSNTPRDVRDADTLLPGTLLMLGWVTEVTVEPDEDFRYRWTREDDPPDDLAFVEVEAMVRSGELSLLLVHADPDRWAQRGQTPFDCLGGEINLDFLEPDDEAVDALLEALGLDEADPDAATRTGPARLNGSVAVHAGGLSVYGAASLPWEDEPAAAPFQLTRLMPDPGRPDGETGPGYRLTVERERLTKTESGALLRAWSNLSLFLNPNHPSNARPTPTPAPRWATLELSDPRRIPDMYWEILTWTEGAELPLRFERGEVNLLVADQAPYDQRRPPTSLARIVLDDLAISVADDGAIEIDIAAGSSDAGGDPDTVESLEYGAGVEPDGRWLESVAFTDLQLAFSPVETPRTLRNDQAIPAPAWTPGDAPLPVDTPVLWGFMPLEDGWAQLPVPNVTEQIYLDAEVARPDAGVSSPPSTSLLQGAVAYGNDRPAVLTAHPDEQPWNVTVSDSRYVYGQWRLEPTGAAGAPAFALATVELTALFPTISVNGLIWLSTGVPRPEDAIPDLENWISGLRSIPLTTVRPQVDVFPPPVTLRVQELAFALRTPDDEATDEPASALLNAWSCLYLIDNAVLNLFVTAGVLPPTAFADHLPLLWRRHPSLPMVQVLPLTQSKAPPNHPSASRQLVPFELDIVADSARDPDDMTDLSHFGVSASNGAASWARVLRDVEPAREWLATPDLPLSALSMPGLTLDAGVSPDVTGIPQGPEDLLPVQYRYDLPYTDETHALAQLPKVARDPQEVSPLPDSPPPAPARPLARDTFAGHWQSLSERASLAAASAREAFAAIEGTPSVEHLVEPKSWPVTVTLDTTAYPGSITIDNATGDSAATSLSGVSALEGISGAFGEDAGGGLRRLPDGATTADAFAVTAGSMAARPAGDGTYRDQRGLLRGASEETGAIVTTGVRLDEDDGSYDLASAVTPIPLQLAGDRTWQLWFRDLPVRAGTFDRQAVRSPAAMDVNDPDALSREYDYLAGYEWRLAGDLPASDDRFLPLCNLQFYPLTIETVGLEGGAVTRVELIGRLQLPLPDDAEVTDLSNAVRVTFETGEDGTLRLTAIAPVAPSAEWPLAMTAGEADDSPRLTWTDVSLNDDGTGLEISGTALEFILFDFAWSVPLDTLTFPEDVQDVTHQHTFTEDPDAALRAQTLDLVLDLTSGAFVHAIDIVMAARIGEPARPAFSAEVRFPVLGAVAGAGTWEAGTLFGDLPLIVDPSPAGGGGFVFGDNALQFHWSTRDAVEGLDRQFLPGMHMDGAGVPGFAIMTFDVPGGGGVPAFRIGSCFQETLLSCRWGAFLQAGATGEVSSARVFGSSAGDLTVGYTAEWNADEERLDESFLLNGMLEVKDLVSFPSAATYDRDAGILSLPPARDAGADTQPALDHTRHSARVLLNQHELPAEALAAAGNGPLFTLGTDSWQFVAVVEHQLVGVTLEPLALRNDRRWTTVQEFRLITPTAFRDFLRSFDELRIPTPTTRRGARRAPEIEDSTFGYLGKGLRESLADPDAGTSELDKLPAETLIVEASALHWIKQQPVGAENPTTLQFLPGGSQHGILSSPDDYQPSAPGDPGFLPDTDPDAPQWTLLHIPFVGRMQDGTSDLVDAPDEAVGDDVSILQVDPVLRLQRNRGADSSAALPPLALAFSSWSDADPFEIAVSGLDGAAGRSWPRLDAVTLEENWFRLQNPLPEGGEPGTDTSTERVASITASLPDTPARLSRAVALRRAFEASRRDYPPRTPGDGDLPPLSLTGAPVWRQDSIAVVQAVTDLGTANDPPYGWHLTAQQLLGCNLGMAADAGATPRRFVAATLLPTRPEADVAAVSFAVSPYSGLEFRPTTADMRARLVSSELLAINPATAALRPVASNLSEVPDAGDVQSMMPEIVRWAGETHRRLSPASPVAVLRLRQINENPTPATTEAVLTTTYAFAIVPGVQRAERLTARSHRVRSPAGELRFREGQFGGSVLPATVAPFEIAPPLVTGLQPLHLRDRPASSLGGSWPWGLSGLRVATQHAPGKEGTVGSIGLDPSQVTLWWQAARHVVQYRTASDGEGAAAGLPPSFRARAIRSLLPVLPDPPLPEIVAAEDLAWSDPDERGRWQPVLPGAMRYVLLGNRPGVFLSLRHHLIRQRNGFTADPDIDARLDQAAQYLRTGDGAAWLNALNTLRAEAGLPPLADPASSGAREALQARERQFWTVTAGVPNREGLVSGSVPVQHRMPRPVPLPSNGVDDASKGVALQPWASHFEPTRNALWGDAPIDEAFYAECGTPPDVQPARRLQIQLVEPRHGRVDPRWNGTFAARIRFDSDDVTIADWEMTVVLADGAGEYAYDAPRPLVSGIDAGLTAAATALANGDVAAWLNALNTLRAQLGLPPLTDPGTAEERAEVQAAEEAFWAGEKDLYRFALPDEDAAAVARGMGNRTPGDVLRIVVSVRPCFPAPGAGECPVTSFDQTLTLPLRFADDVGPRLPLLPHFIHFEDPEYNRQLSSPAGIATAIVQRLEPVNDPNPSVVVVHTATVATDRQEYNPSSDIAVRYDWDADQDLPDASVEFTRVDTGGNETTVTFDAPDGSAIGALTSGALLQFSLGSATRDGNPVELEPGDTLRAKVTITGTGVSTPGEIFLDATIVEAPVIPVPSAAYALLRAEELDGVRQVECVRFAWGPEATRIELTCSDDLRTEIVRRRAVFNWTDSVRPGTLREYAVQKIAAGGSTHVPPLQLA